MLFRSRAEDGAELRLKVLLLHRSPDPDLLSDRDPDRDADQHPDRDPEQWAEETRTPTSRRILTRARRLATDHQIAVSELMSGRPDNLEAIAELVALTDFAAAYLGLASSGAGHVPAGAAPADT